MPNNGTDRETANLSEASREVRCRELAVLDWAKTPSKTIREMMGNVAWQTLAHYRDTEEYKETIRELREEWMEAVSRIPNGTELRSKIALGMTLSLDRLIEILVPQTKAALKDRISAARLVAQLDGRFLKGDEDGDTPKNVDSVATELLAALRKQETAVN